jgi:hypothetical protein
MKALTQDQLLAELEKALTTQKLAEVKVHMLQTRLTLSGSTMANPATAKPNRYQSYIDDNFIHDPEDQELILRESMTREEAAEELGESPSTIYRLLKRGILKESTDSRNRRLRIDSISVYEYLQFGRPEAAR